MADPDSSTQLIGLNRAVDYADSAEIDLLRIILAARDRSADSDELGAHVSDWPTMYHLSPGRANLLRPFNWDHRMRTLEVGAGCGALTRFLGETGARVDAVEGSLARARVIEARCLDLDNVKIFAGDVSDLGHDERYDVVVLVGVSEYIGRDERQDASAEAFLQRISDRLTRDGVLILSIENQLGLKYLAGWKEDHVGVPFIGLQDYLGADGIRTYTRAELARFLTGCGLSKIRWFYPFPDHTLPVTILTHDAAADPGLSGFCCQLVGPPAADHDHSASPLYDAEVAMRVWGRAGLLPEVANSFLVVAARAEEALDALTPRGVLAWHFSDPNRLNLWTRTQVIERNENGHIRVCSLPRSPQPRPRQGWLSQRPEAERPFVTGTVLRDAIKDAFRTGQVQRVERILRRWRNWLRQQASVSHFQGEPRRNPFAAAFGASVLLPPRFVDVSLGNFVEGDDGNLHYIDAEWEADGGVYLDAVCLRSLWWLAYDLISNRVPLPWSSELRVSELTRILCTLAQIPSENAEVTDEFLSAEAEHNNLVFKKGPTRILDDVRAVNVHSAAGMEHQLAEHKAVLADRERQLAEHKAVLADRERQLAEHKAVLADRERQLAEHKVVLADRERQVAEHRAVLAKQRRSVR